MKCSSINGWLPATMHWPPEAWICLRALTVHLQNCAPGCSASFVQTKTFARAAAREMAEALPQLVTDRMARAQRPGKVFIDWGQNDPNKSTIAPYSLRATRWPGVSTPLRWEEVEQVAATGEESLVRFGPADVLSRIERHGDLFREAARGDQRLNDG